jgi:hypothetical protein
VELETRSGCGYSSPMNTARCWAARDSGGLKPAGIMGRRVPKAGREADQRVMLLFEWDPEKAQQNTRRHGVSFEDSI